MVAMLIATEISQQVLSGHQADDRLIELAPTLPSRSRLNRSVGDTRVIIASAERMLAYMAIPHTLSIHHRTMAESLAMLRDDGHPVQVWRTRKTDAGDQQEIVSVDPYDVGLSEIHQVFRWASGAETDGRDVFDAAEMKAFELVRQLRNRLAHQGATGGPSLKEQWQAARGDGQFDDGQALWTQLAKRPLAIVPSGQELVLGSGELFATLAICKRLEDAAERELIRILSVGALADIVAQDYASRFPHRLADKSRLTRRLEGFRKREYPSLRKVEKEDLSRAATRFESRQG